MGNNCKCVGMLSGGKWDKLIDNSRRVYDPDYISPTVTACGGGNQEVKISEQIPAEKSEETGKNQGVRVRKLTPKEVWRLMGFSDDDYEKAEKVVSKSQLYKQAGNSIVVNVLMEIFKEMLP